jgi:hypothetical protein
VVDRLLDHDEPIADLPSAAQGLSRHRFAECSQPPGDPPVAEFVAGAQ